MTYALCNKFAVLQEHLEYILHWWIKYRVALAEYTESNIPYKKKAVYQHGNIGMILILFYYSPYSMVEPDKSHDRNIDCIFRCADLSFYKRKCYHCSGKKCNNSYVQYYFADRVSYLTIA